MIPTGQHDDPLHYLRRERATTASTATNEMAPAPYYEVLRLYERVPEKNDKLTGRGQCQLHSAEDLINRDSSGYVLMKGCGCKHHPTGGVCIAKDLHSQTTDVIPTGYMEMEQQKSEDETPAVLEQTRGETMIAEGNPRYENMSLDSGHHCN